MVGLEEITKADDNSFEITCSGRTSANRLTSTYLPVWTYKDKNKKNCVMFKANKPRFKDTTPWTWTILAEDFSTSAVVRCMVLNSNGKLDSKSKRLVTGMFKRFQLKRFKPTS